MKELTYEEFCEQPMQYRMGMSGDKGARRLYRNDALGIQKEVHTPRNPRTASWGNGRAYYFIDNDLREFSTPADLYVAWMERVCAAADERSAAPTPLTGARKPNLPDPAPSLEGVRNA